MTQKGCGNMKRILICMLACVMMLSSFTTFALEKEEWLSPDQFYAQQLSAEHRKAWENDIANVSRRWPP